MTDNIEEGTIAYDLAQLEPVIIVDENIGTIASLDNPRRELVTNSNGNQAVGFKPDTPVANVTYFDMQSQNNSVYAMPHTRLGVPTVEIGDHEFTPRQYIQYSLLRDVAQEAVSDGPDAVTELEALFGGLTEYEPVLEAIEDILETA